MRPMARAPLRPSFLQVVSTFVSCTVFCALAVADRHIVDDQDDNPKLQWGEGWTQTSQISARDETLTLGNQTGETMTFTFTGELEPFQHGTSSCYTPRADPGPVSSTSANISTFAFQAHTSRFTGRSRRSEYGP